MDEHVGQGFDVSERPRRDIHQRSIVAGTTPEALALEEESSVYMKATSPWEKGTQRTSLPVWITVHASFCGLYRFLVIVIPHFNGGAHVAGLRPSSSLFFVDLLGIGSPPNKFLILEFRYIVLINMHHIEQFRRLGK
jgi:hypothetical protein